MNHTPAPWTLECETLDRGWSYPRLFVTISTLDCYIATYDTGFAEYPDEETCKANAEYIVKCVNNHEQLLKALRRLMSNCYADVCCDAIDDSLDHAADVIRGIDATQPTGD